MKNHICFLLLVFWVLSGSCASRKITIKSEPPGAKVIVDGQEKGITPCKFPFTYYGNRQIILEKDGYQTLNVIVPVKPTFMHAFPFDILLVFIPYPMMDHHSFSYQLALVASDQHDVRVSVERGKELKEYLKKYLGKNEPRKAE